MLIFILGILVFFGMHSVSIFASGWRDAQMGRLGEQRWKGLYSFVSIVGFVAMLYGYGLARHTPVVVYTPPLALRHLVLLLMVPVFPLFIAAYVPGRIKRISRNPMLLSVILWSLSHLIANGMLNDVLMFGAFLVWAVADLISVSRRTQPRPLPSAPPSAFNDAIVVVVGLGLYVFMLLWGHAHLIGVSPLG